MHKYQEGSDIKELSTCLRNWTSVSNLLTQIFMVFSRKNKIVYHAKSILNLSKEPKRKLYTKLDLLQLECVNKSKVICEHP